MSKEITTFEYLLNHIRNPIIILNEKGQIVWFNEMFQSQFGWSMSELAGHPIAPLFEKGGKPFSIQGLLVKGDKPTSLFKGPVTLADKTGNTVSLEAELIQIDAYTNPFFALILDTRKETDHVKFLVEAKKEAEEAKASQSSFLANVSHEIRTPLNAIMGLSQLLINLGLPPKQEKYARSIYQSGDALLTIINDLLDISKMEAGELKLELIPCDLCQLIEEVVLLLAPKAFEKSLPLHFYYPPTLPRRVITDPTRFREIIMNFLSNAIKFTENGYVLVTCCLKWRHGDQLAFEFAVSDTGLGISEEFKSRIFHKFTQADVSLTKGFAGTGLGLAISKLLVERLGGEIGFDTAEQKGSTFFAILPFSEVKEPPSAPFTPIRKKVLIVDPNEIDRFILTDYCLFLGMEVMGAVSVDQAVELLQVGRFSHANYDLVIHSFEAQDEALFAELELHDNAKALLFEWEQIYDQYETDPEDGEAILLPKPTSVVELREKIHQVFSKAAAHG